MQVLTSLEGFKETKRKWGPRSLESQRSRISPSLLRFGRPEGETVRRRLGVQRTQALPLALVLTNKPGSLSSNLTFLICQVKVTHGSTVSQDFFLIPRTLLKCIISNMYIYIYNLYKANK